MSDFKSIRSVVFKSTDLNSSLLQENRMFRRNQGRTPSYSTPSSDLSGTHAALVLFLYWVPQLTIYSKTIG